MAKKLLVFVLFNKQRLRSVTKTLSTLESTADLNIQVIGLCSDRTANKALLSLLPSGSIILDTPHNYRTLHAMNAAVDTEGADYVSVIEANSNITASFFPTLVERLSASNAVAIYPDMVEVTKFGSIIRRNHIMPPNPTLHSILHVASYGSVVRAGEDPMFTVADTGISYGELITSAIRRHGVQVLMHAPDQVIGYMHPKPNGHLLPLPHDTAVRNISSGPVKGSINGADVKSVHFKMEHGGFKCDVLLWGIHTQSQLDTQLVILRRAGYLNQPWQITVLVTNSTIQSSNVHTVFCDYGDEAKVLNSLLNERVGEYVLVVHGNLTTINNDFLPDLVGALGISNSVVAGGMLGQLGTIRMRELGHELTEDSLVPIGAGASICARGPQGAYGLPHTVSVCSDGVVLLKVPASGLQLNHSAGRAWLIDLCSQYPDRVVASGTLLYTNTGTFWESVPTSAEEAAVSTAVAFMQPYRYYSKALMDNMGDMLV